MMTLTLIARDEATETTEIRMHDGRKHEAILRVHADGSYSVVSGAAWLPKNVRGPALRSALAEAKMDGRATVDAR